MVLQVGFWHHRRVHFTYELVGTGWAAASIEGADSSVELHASYLGDALGVLLGAINALLEGGESARCSWEVEPGEFRWIFARRGAAVELTILTLPSAFPELPDEDGNEIFRTVEPLREVASSVANAAQRILDDLGEAEYLDRWVQYPFPIERLRSLQNLLLSPLP